MNSAACIPEQQQIGFEDLQIAFEDHQIGFEDLQIGFEALQIGFEDHQIGFEDLQTGFEALQIGSEDLQTGDEDLLFGLALGHRRPVVKNLNKKVEKVLPLAIVLCYDAAKYPNIGAWSAMLTMQTSGRKAFRRHAIACVYDADNRRTEMVDGSGTTTWTYNSANAITALSTPQGNYSYTYNDALQRVTMVESSLSTPNTTSYAYSGTTGLQTSITNRFSEVTSLEYDSHGRLEKKTLHAGHYEQTGYDSRGRVTSIVLKDSSHATLRSQAYVYDKANFILEHTVGSNTTEYTYDAAGQLIREEKPWLSYDREYEYDGNGNRTLHVDGGINPKRYLYAPGDKLTAIQEPDLLDWVTIRSFTYDADGRMVTDSEDSRTLTWDAEGRLTQITDSGGTVGHAYNGLNTRVSRSSGGTVTFSRDGVGVTSPLMRDSGGMAYTPGTSYRSGSTTTYMHSGLKSVEFESTGPSTVNNAAAYDAFGNDVVSRSFGSNFGYGGTFGYQSDSTGYQLLGHRWYDPTIGRFLTRDPAKDGRNWYTYCANEPVGNVDPEGLVTLAVGVSGSGELVHHTAAGGMELTLDTLDPSNSGTTVTGSAGLNTVGGTLASGGVDVTISIGPQRRRGYSRSRSMSISLASLIELDFEEDEQWPTLTLRIPMRSGGTRRARLSADDFAFGYQESGSHHETYSEQADDIKQTWDTLREGFGRLVTPPQAYRR